MQEAVFLDRDGVINEVLSHRVRFVNKASDFYLLEGVGEAVKSLNNMGFKVFVVTNQGGVGLGYMTESALEEVHQKMRDDLAAFGEKLMILHIVHISHSKIAHAKTRCSNVT